MAKILLACVTDILAYMAKTHNMLPDNHFSCRPSRTTMDSLHFITKYIKDAWRKGKVVSALFLDIKSAFPSMMLGQLLCNLRMRGILASTWSGSNKNKSRTTTLSFNSYASESVTLLRGIDQGCLLSGIFYNTDLIDICGLEDNKTAVTFIDDTLLLVHSKTLSEANGKVKSMMKWPDRGLEWVHSHPCSLTMDKCDIMGLTRRREHNLAKRPPTKPTQRHPLALRGTQIPVFKTHKFLGMLIDQELHWKEHVNYVLCKE